MTARAARLLILGAAVLWSTGGAAIKLAHASATPWQIAGGRALFAAAALALVLPEARRGLADRRVLALSAAYAATTVLFVFANALTTAANAIFLQDAAPLWVMVIAALLLREGPTRVELALAPVFLGGMTLFFLDRIGVGAQSGAAAALGNAIAVLSGIAFAFLIVGLRALRGAGAEAAVLAGNVLSFAVCLPGAAAGPLPGARDLAIVAYLGIFQLAAAYTLFARGLRRLSAVEASLLALAEPVLNPIWAFLLAGERPGPYAIAGAALILGATAARVVFVPREDARP